MVWKQYACNLSKSIRFRQVFSHFECKDNNFLCYILKILTTIKKKKDSRMLDGMVPELDRAKISCWSVNFTSDLAFAWLAAAFEFFSLPLANNFWTVLIFYLISYVAFVNMFTRWKVWMHSDKIRAKDEEHKSGPFLFPFTGFGAVPSPLLFCPQSPSPTCFALLKTSSSAEKKTLG